MFVQVIEGRAGDAAALRERGDVWERDLRPGSIGWLGATGGATSDGRLVLVARFESAEAAKANGDRPEQGEWWAETEKCFDGDVTFHDSDDVEELLGGGSNDAGFVQVMKYGDVDRADTATIDQAFEAVAAQWRPDVLGGIRAWTGPRSCIEVMYFTSEADARAGEGAEPPAELEPHMATFEAMMAGVEFLDISDPWLY